ncbi:MAG: porin [Bdellovibrionota bacterium]
MRKIIALAGLSLLLPFTSQARTLEDILVEKGIVTRNELALVKEETAEEPVKIYWNEGSRVEFPDDGFTARVYTKFRSRYEFIDNDGDVENEDNFENTDLTLGIDGTALYNDFYYKFDANFAKDGSDMIEDAYVQWQPCDNMYARLGQWRTEISRQSNTSSSKKQFLDDTVASSIVDKGYLHGFGAGGDVLDGKIKFGASVRGGTSDGEGSNRPGIDNDVAGYAYARWDVLGEMDPFEEGDLANTEDLAINVGTAYGYSDMNALGDVYADQALSADINLKYRGLSLAGEYFYDKLDAEITDDSADYNGFYVQAGYFVLPQQLELASRFGYSDCDGGRMWGQCAGNDNIKQASVVANYYFWGQHLKAQVGYDMIQEKDASTRRNDNTNKWLVGVSTWW